MLLGFVQLAEFNSDTYSQNSATSFLVSFSLLLKNGCLTIFIHLNKYSRVLLTRTRFLSLDCPAHTVPVLW